jgi:hypothetical protein
VVVVEGSKVRKEKDMATAAADVKPRSIGRMALANPPLTPIEQRVFDCYQRAARLGAPAPSTEEMTEMIGALSDSTIPGITRRIEEKGYITRQIFQRGRVICIAETGHCTAPPNDTSPHWRLRADRVPTPAIQAVRQRSMPLAAMIEAEARLTGRSLTDFLADLVYIGWHEYAAEKERGE